MLSLWKRSADIGNIICHIFNVINIESADLSQSESVLAYIVINQYLAILQTPISHYCNTLQSPILQIAIYLYCRVQLSDCSILKGLGQIRHRGHQVATGRQTLWPQVASNQ